MKSKRIVWIAAIFVPLAFFVGQKFGGGSSTQGKKEPLYYQHPMRPDIRSSVPAKDEMGMDYIPVYEKKTSQVKSPMSDRAPVSLSSEAARSVGVRTSVATSQDLVRKVQTYGTVAFDPSLYNALAEYREAIRAREEVSGSPLSEVIKHAQGLVDASRLKLSLLGIQPSQIQHEKGLLINERGRGVWVYAELYEQDVPIIHSGVSAIITSPSLPGQSVRGKVRSIDPTINPTTRTSRARIELQTVNENLRPEMLVDVVLEVPLGKRLSVPIAAIFDTGRHSYVFVETKGHDYMPTPVTVGVRATDFAEILEGVHEGDRVVTHANFLIDSESRFQATSGENSHD